MTKNLGQCSVKISMGYSASGNPHCQKPAVVERDGKLFCTIHDPEYIKAKQVKWKAEFNKKYAKHRERDELLTARKRATQGLTLQELSQVTPELIRNALKANKKEK